VECKSSSYRGQRLTICRPTFNPTTEHYLAEIAQTIFHVQLLDSLLARPCLSKVGSVLLARDVEKACCRTVVQGIIESHQAGLLSEVAPRRCCFYLLPLQKAHSGFGRSIFAILTLLWGLIDSFNPTLIGLTVSAHVCFVGYGEQLQGGP
jgi:hypothetical protein